MIKLKNIGTSKMVIGTGLALNPGESIEITKKNSDLCQSLNDKYPANFSIIQEGVPPVKLELPKQDTAHLAVSAEQVKKKESK